MDDRQGSTVMGLSSHHLSSHLPIKRWGGLYFSPDEPVEGDPAPAPDVGELQKQIEALQQENTRYKENNTGLRQFMTAGQERGFRSRADFESFDPDGYKRFRDFESRTKGKIDIDSLLSLVSGDGHGAEQTTPAVDKDALRDELLETLRGEVRGELSKGHATAEHQQREKAVQDRLDKYLEELGTPESLREYERDGLLGAIQRASDLYDDDHPLRESALRLPDDDALGKILEKHKTAYASARGQAIQDKADAAKKGGVTTPAGNVAPNGKPTTTAEGKPRPGSPEHRRQVEEAIEKRRKARGQGAVSSVG